MKTPHVIVLSHYDHSAIIAVFGPYPDEATADRVSTRMQLTRWMADGAYEVFPLELALPDDGPTSDVTSTE